MTSAINRWLINNADDSLRTIPTCSYVERLCFGGENFILKVQVFKARPAVAVRGRDRCRLRMRQRRKRLRCSRYQNDEGDKTENGDAAGEHFTYRRRNMGSSAHQGRVPINVRWTCRAGELPALVINRHLTL